MGDRLHQHVPVPREHPPFHASLVPTGVDELGDIGKPDDGLHTRHVSHPPLKRVDFRHHVKIDAALRDGFADDDEGVDTDVEARIDGATIDVVDRIGAQLGNAHPQIADFDVRALPEPEPEQSRGEDDHGKGRARSGHGGDPLPYRVKLLSPPVDALSVLVHRPHV